ncbi:hypothetical protein LCGC14_2281810 [marine sediment metagenome]|uniref:HK97 gp10 family phage protein n=1 Tax=marine sediment metagenome TaxID=412755 RepID=A0A0F9FP61_9ZZZZ
MANVKVTITGLGQNFVRIQAQTIALIAERQIEAMARETEIVIQQKIQERIKRDGSTGHLARSFFTVKTTDGWGVGDIDFLNANAKQWHWLNYGIAQSGRTTPPGTNENPRIRGHFTSHTKGRFMKGSPSFPMNPTKPIEAINYIQATLNEVNGIIAKVLARG